MSHVIDPIFVSIETKSAANNTKIPDANIAVIDSGVAWKLNPPADILFVARKAPSATVIAIQNKLDSHNDELLVDIPLRI